MSSNQKITQDKMIMQVIGRLKVKVHKGRGSSFIAWWGHQASISVTPEKMNANKEMLQSIWIILCDLQEILIF